MLCYIRNMWIYKKVWIFAYLFIFIGGMIYVLYRPDNILLFRVTDSLGMKPLIDVARLSASQVKLPLFVINSLPAGLWAASYLMMMYITTRFQGWKMVVMCLTKVLAVLLSEACCLVVLVLL